MRSYLAVVASVLAGCTTLTPLADIGDAQVVLLGEQHDADSHRTLQERWVVSLAARGTLVALALEMAERGVSTAGLPRSAGDADVQQALRWHAEAWPWDRYRPAIMAAVRAGVPVLGANLPRAEMRDAMRDGMLDRLLPGPALKAQQQAIRLGHCELLPEHQITPMTRVQIARDRAMAQVIEGSLVPGKVVVLLAGSGHVQADVGVPQHLPASLALRPIVLPPEPVNGKDHCAELRKQFSK